MAAPQYQLTPEAAAPPPQQAQEPAAPQAPVEEPKSPEFTVDEGDRTMSPEEAEAYFRGEVYRDDEDADLPFDEEQSQMAGEFFAELGPEARQGATPVGPSGAPPGAPPEGWQQAMQSGVATSPTSQPSPSQPAPLAGADASQQAQQQGQLTPQQAQQQFQQMPGQQAPQQAPTQVPVQVQQTPQEAALQAQITLLTQTNQALQQQAQRTVQQQGVQAQPQVAAPGPPAQINVPDQYMNALAHEDINVRREALNGVLNAAVQTALQTVGQQVEAEKANVRQQIMSEIQGQREADRISTDMYGTYPELEQHKALVSQAVGQVAPGASPSQWNADVRDLVAERVAQYVPGLYEKIQGNRAQRLAQGQYGVAPQLPQPQMQAQYPQAPQLPQGLPQAQAPLAPQMPYTHPQQQVGGAHGAPQYMRDVSGNLVQVPPQQYFAPGVHTSPRPEPSHGGYSMAEDIQRTLF